MTNFEKAIAKIKEFAEESLRQGWIVKGYRYTRINGVEKYGVTVQNKKGEIIQFNQQI